MNTPRSVAERTRAQLWHDPQHWERFGVYRCADDPRLIVPQRKGWGWTLNMAHSWAQPALWGFLSAVVAFVLTLVLIVARTT